MTTVEHDSRTTSEYATTPSPAARCIETHVGVVILVGQRAYKVKKPVQVGFLDFTNREARLAACQREVELNRRLVPDVYLGVADLSDPVTEEPAEHLVVMRRMPENRRLSSMITRGEQVGEPLRQLARLLASFHAQGRRGEAISREGSAVALSRRWAVNVDRTAQLSSHPVSRGVIDQVGRLAQRFVAGRAALFEARCAEGRVVDGHGDLIADDVFCLPDGPRVLDCLEFDDALRYVDGLDDAAFLAMDLERLGRADLAEQFFTDYARFSGDPAPISLRRHYVAYRAWVRVLVNCLRAEQGGADALELVARYTQLTLRHLRSAAVRLVLIGGLPASGKTTLAERLADSTGAVLLSSDRVRKELAGVEPGSTIGAGYREGMYSPIFTDRVYDEMLQRAQHALEAGEHVVLDASWTDRRYRHLARTVAEQTRGEFVQLRCDAPTAERMARLNSRGPSLSDATPAIARVMAADAAPWPEAGLIDTTNDPERCLGDALLAWESATDVRR